MASTGNVFPTASVNVDRAGNAAWTSPGNVTADDGTDTTGVVPTDYLVTSTYGFSIPTDATIQGVTVRVDVSETGAGTSNFVVQLHSDATPTLIGSSKNSGTISGTTKVVDVTGSATDLWGATLTPAIVNAAGFGVSLWSTDTTNTLAIDFVTIAVEYSLPTDDGDVSWWAGTQQCFTGVAKAGAAAALGLAVAISGSFYQNEDIVPEAIPGAAAGAPPTQRARAAPVFQRWFHQDELPSASQPVALEEGGDWQAPTPLSGVPRALPAWDDQALSWYLDDDQGWQPPTIALQAPRLLPAWDDNQALSWTLVEEYDWKNPTTYQPAAVQFVGWHQDDLPTVIASLAADDADWLMPAAPRATPNLQVWSEDDHAVPQLLVDEQYWEQPRYAVPPLDLRVWATDAEIELLQVDEQYWIAPPVQARVVDLRIWSVEDEVAYATSIPVDELYWQQPKYTPPPLDLRVWATDDEIELLKVDEQYWQPPAIVPAPVQFFTTWHQDDLSSVAALAADDPAWPAPAAARAPTLTLWTADDEIVLQPQLGPDAAAGAPPTQRAKVSPVFQRWYQQDELPAAAQPVALDDGGWQPPTPRAGEPRLWSQFANDELAPTFATAFPDDAWMPPVPARLNPIARIWTDQDERTTTPTFVPVEDYWLRLPRAAVPVFSIVYLHQDEIGTPAAPGDTYTHDSRARIGGAAGAVRIERVGSAIGNVAPRRIGPGSARVGTKRIGGSKQ